jgi:phage/conjugal plasmid C-4 type zinc finger TraR family protein
VNRADDGPRDEADAASDREEEMRDDAIARVRRRLATDPEHWEQTSAKWCEARHCGERIPDARRRAVPGCRYCAECQSLVERGKALP